MSGEVMVAGASGLIGSNLVTFLSGDPDCKEILLLVKKKLEKNTPRVRQLKIDFNIYQEYLFTDPIKYKI